MNRLISSTDPLGNTTNFSYDSLANLSSVADPLAHSITFLNDSAGNVTATTDALGRITRYTYDTMNRLLSVTDALDHSTTYSYDPTGNLSSVTDAKGNTTTFGYDAMNRLSSSTDPLGRTENYQYDFNGNLIRKTNHDGASIDFVYDAANQLAQKTTSSAHPEPVEGPNTTSYIYDVDGNLTSVLDSDSDVSFAYDPLDRVIRTTAQRPSPSALEYSYDPAGNRLTMTQLASDPWPLTTTYSYDAMNRLIQLTNPESQSWHFSYDLAGRRTRLFHPNNIVTSYSYDAASRLLALHHDHSTTGPLAHFDYAYDPVGNRIQKGELDGATAYGYDALNRLISAATTIPGLPQEFYSYDAVGNRITSYLSLTHSHDAANQLLEDQQFSYTYDPNGNQTGKTAKDGAERWAYTYDAENQLVRVDKFVPATALSSLLTAHYSYDGMGRRITKTVNGLTTTYVYDNEDILTVEREGSWERLVHGVGFDDALARTNAAGSNFLLRDGQNTVVLDATIGSEDRYDSFGVLRVSPSQARMYGFHGREMDLETGLIYLRFRYLDPSVGRFLQPDPLGPLSSYREFGNNPLFFTDPWGLFLEDLFSGARDGHSSQAVTYQDFIDAADGKALAQLQHEVDQGQASSMSAGGPADSYRYVVDPANPNQVIDMRHFLAVGPKGELFGLGIELLQLLADQGSAFDPQDFFSNALGKDFFKNFYDPKDGSLSEQLDKFFKDRAKKNGCP